MTKGVLGCMGRGKDRWLWLSFWELVSLSSSTIVLVQAFKAEYCVATSETSINEWRWKEVFDNGGPCPVQTTRALLRRTRTLSWWNPCRCVMMNNIRVYLIRSYDKRSTKRSHPRRPMTIRVSKKPHKEAKRFELVRNQKYHKKADNLGVRNTRRGHAN